MRTHEIARISANALKTALPPTWVRAARQQVRAVAGKGWSVSPQSGYVKLGVRYADGTRAAAQVHLPWRADSVPQLLAAVVAVAADVRGGLPLAAAVARLGYRREGAPERAGADWATLGAAFRSWLVGGGTVSERTWHRTYSPVLRDLAAADPATVRDALGAVATGAPGSRGRQVRVTAAARLLRWGVEADRLPERWLPPRSVAPWVGKAPPAKPKNLPRTDAEVAALVAAFEGDRWWPVVATVAVLGCRPHELRHLQWQPDGTARVLAGKTGPRTVVPLCPAGVDLARVQRSRLPRLPKTDERASLELSACLKRRPAWEGWNLYLLRHSYADRAHRLGLLPKDAAALMGHTLAQHLATYQRHGDSDSAVAAALRLTTHGVP